MLPAKTALLAGLQSDILRLEGFKTVTSPSLDAGLGPIRDAFPNATFPLGAVHEFLSAKAEETAAAAGFIAGLLASLMKGGGASLWISTSRTVFPPALKSFGIDPDRIIFVDLPREKEVIWAMEAEMNRKDFRLLLTLAIVAFWSAGAWAQRLDGTLRGSVEDPSQAVVVGATVTATNQDTGVSQSATTTSAGTYVFPNLTVGTYTVTVDAKTFQKYSRKNIQVLPNQVVTADAKLTAGAS